MTVTEYLRTNARINTRETLITMCMHDLSVGRTLVVKKLYEIQSSKTPVKFGIVESHNEAEPPKTNGKIHGISETELRKKHDIKFIIEQNAQRLVLGEYVMERDFVRQCNITTGSGYRQFLEDETFDKYKGKASGVTYWAHPESINKMKSEGILR